MKESASFVGTNSGPMTITFIKPVTLSKTHGPGSVIEVNPVTRSGLPDVPKTDSPPVIEIDPPQSNCLEKWPPMPMFA